MRGSVGSVVTVIMPLAKLMCQIWTLIDERQGDLFNEISDISFNSSENLVAYRAASEDGWCVVAGNYKSRPYTHVWPPSFSPDGKSISYVALRNRELSWNKRSLN